MTRLLGAILLCLVATAPVHASESPWDPARAGKIECFGSNLTSKTCDTMTVYRWLDDGTVEADTRSPNEALAPGVVVLSRWRASIKGNTNCSVMLKSDVEANTFEQDGQLVSDADTIKYRRKMTDRLSEMFGRTYCRRIGKYGREYTAQITIDGREMPSDANWLAWIDKTDGFTLSP